VAYFSTVATGRIFDRHQHAFDIAEVDVECCFNGFVVTCESEAYAICGSLGLALEFVWRGLMTQNLRVINPT
jgi:hypothetical protein